MTAEDGYPIDVRAGVDSDLDGQPDTLLVPDAIDLVLAVDTDHDGFADLLVEVGPDAVARTSVLDGAGPPAWRPTDPLADACYDGFGGSAP